MFYQQCYQSSKIQSWVWSVNFNFFANLRAIKIQDSTPNFIVIMSYNIEILIMQFFNSSVNSVAV